jgi:hypothetical protein
MGAMIWRDEIGEMVVMPLGRAITVDRPNIAEFYCEGGALCWRTERGSTASPASVYVP